MLATSRAPLRIRGEREYPLAPLDLPSPASSPNVDEVATSPAVALFVDRARAANPAFELTQDNAATVAMICRRLEGLPLALELAAARTRFLGPKVLLGRLDQALEEGGARDLPERQRTMRATLKWSYDLLSEQEKVLFRRLSVFSGGFSLEAAEALGLAMNTRAEDVLGVLGGLTEQSLVVATDWAGAGGEVRYRMLEPIRQYAQELLVEHPAEAEEAQRRHAEFFLDLVERAEPELIGGPS